MSKKIAILLLFLLLLHCSNAGATPTTIMISTFSASSWLPLEANKNACEIVDSYLMNHYNFGVLDGSKSPDKRAMCKRIGNNADYVLYIELTGFYDPPYTTAHMSSSIKITDTVAMVLLHYTVYVVALDKWITGSVDQQVVYPGTAIALEVAYPEAVRKAIPKLTNEINTIIK